MALRIIILCIAFSSTYGGFISSAPAVRYSDATAVSSSYLHQATAPVNVVHAAPAVTTYQAAALAPAAIHDPHYGSSHQSVYRSLGGDQAISHYSKAIDSAFSSVRKYDTRITNDGLRLMAAPVLSHHAPAFITHNGPTVLSASQLRSSPIVAHSAPIVAHTAPLVAHSATPVVAKSAVAYSPATVVSHTTFTGLGAHYEW